MPNIDNYARIEYAKQTTNRLIMPKLIRFLEKLINFQCDDMPNCEAIHANDIGSLRKLSWIFWIFTTQHFRSFAPEMLCRENSENSAKISEDPQFGSSGLYVSDSEFSRHNISGALLRKCCVVKIQNLKRKFKEKINMSMWLIES